MPENSKNENMKQYIPHILLSLKPKDLLASDVMSESFLFMI